MKGGWSAAHLRQWWWIAFVLGALMINFPFLRIFDREVTVGGWPLLFLYLMGGWAVSIAAIAGYALLLRRVEPPGEEEK
ncbi:hypothetical protein [Deferrisoma camini]|uniref:hypothetical protein n=1 Tax=Deferrisoma camini TaxID=1035120 RepID=UPI00046D3E23|nr:hypothetical protein [Deferrisoma camini]NOY45651.1 hypothetical protein [Deltaproteobacteria bacterium]